MQGLSMFEGIKGWAEAGIAYVQGMDKYDADGWLKALRFLGLSGQ